MDHMIGEPPTKDGLEEGSTMLKTLHTHVRHNVVGYIALFVALGGTTYAATGGNFILGQANTAGSTTALSSGTTGPAFKVTSTNTSTGATALGLNAATGHAPFTVNSGTKVTNLNADKLDGLDSTSFVSSSKLRRVGPVAVSPAPFHSEGATIATVGHYTFNGTCTNHDGANNDQVQTYITSDVDHSAYASMTQDEAGRTFGAADMAGNTSYFVADATVPTGTGGFNPISGNAVGPDGQEIVFNLYQGINVRNQPGQCIWGGSFIVK
jgi:hypothetical protein